MRRHFGKWFSLRYGFGNLLKSLTLAPWSFFTGIFDPHMPQPYRRSAFDRAWQLWGPQLDATCRHAVRDLTDLSEWLVRYDTLCRGEFHPQGLRECRLMTLTEETIDPICETIRSQKCRMLCLNDHESIRDFEGVCRKLCAAFEALVPEKSSYER